LLFSLLLLCCNNDRQAKQIEEQIEQVENPIPEPIPEIPDFPYEEMFESLKAMHRAGLDPWDDMEFMAKIRAADEEGRRKLHDISDRARNVVWAEKSVLKWGHYGR
ncbi:MAG: hypothetical protein LBU70_06770, partial [Chitinispirillales bacterium]|nr:hypothetical protein [Chitinispirillales bacterium]